MNDAIIISDVHLASPACRADLLIEFLSTIKEKTKLLIINGDLFDSLDFRRLCKSHWKVLSLLRKLSKELQIVWIVGNHDQYPEIIANLVGVEIVPEYQFFSGGKKLLILHGHQFDTFLDEYPTITWIVDIIYGVLQKIDKTHTIARWAKHSSKTFIRCLDQIRQESIKYANELNADIVITGHTHSTEYHLDEETGIEYYNSGCWTELPVGWIEVKDEVISLMRKY